MVAQILAIIIFLAMFALIVSEKIERHTVALVAGALMVVVVLGICLRDFGAIWETLNLETFVHLSFWHTSGHSESSAGINWETIVFIAGMMVMVEGMGRAGFFEWLCLGLAKAVHYKVMAIFVTFMLMSAALSMFIDSITVILFLAAVTVQLARLLRFDPVPMIIAEVFCANLGGSATMSGDPPNIIIGTALGYSFGDFLTNTGLIALICLVFVLIYFILVYRKSLRPTGEVDPKTLPHPADSIKNKKDFVLSCLIFAIAIVLLVTHAQTGLTVSTIGVGIAIITLIVNGRASAELMKKLDYKTLSFFIGLFMVIGGLEQTGVLKLIADLIAKLSGDNLMIMAAIVLWLSAVASAFVDNIPFAATMVPVIRSLAATQGVDLHTLAWSLAIGTDVGGSATPIGASANVVGISVASKNGHMIGWGRYCKVAAPATILVVLIAMVCIFVRYI